MRIGVKYCGGCNPYYDAADAFKQLQKAAIRKLEPYDTDNPPEVLVVLNLCQSRCLSTENFGEVYRTIRVDNESSLNAAIEELKNV